MRASVIALLLALQLASTANDPPVDLAVLEARAVSLSSRDNAAFKVSGQTFLLNVGKALVRPIQPKPEDAWIIVPTIIGAGVAWNYDIETHDFLRNRVPDPIIADRRLSYWASYGGEGWFDVAIFGLVAAADQKKGKRVALAGMTALTATMVASRVGKVLFRFERPSYDPQRKVMFSDRILAADAMPSGHTMAAFATASVLAREYPRYAPAFYGLATWVAFARVQQSTHWMSDTIVGAGMGILFGFASVELTRAVNLGPFADGAGGGLSVSGEIGAVD